MDGSGSITDAFRYLMRVKGAQQKAHQAKHIKRGVASTASKAQQAKHSKHMKQSTSNKAQQE